MTDPKNYFWRIEVVCDTSEPGILSINLYQVTAPDREQALAGIAKCILHGDRRVVGGPFCMTCWKPVSFKKSVAKILDDLLGQCPACQGDEPNKV